MDSTLAAWLTAAEGSDDSFVDGLWRTVLRREAEPEARERALTELRLGVSRSELLYELVTSPEFAGVRLLDDAVAWAGAERRKGARPRSLRAPAGTDERPIEIPWVLARYGGEPRLLDVGYAFAQPAYLAGLVGLGAAELTGIDLVELEVPGLHGVVGDLRRLPFADRSFDVITAISTLEHVGRDNTQYGLDSEIDDSSLDGALAELRRVLADDGRLLVTVPTGDEERRPEQVVLSPQAWVQLFEAAGFLIFEDELYELGANGWHSVPALGADVRYGTRGPGASAVLCAELRPQRLSTRVRLAVRDRRFADEPRRATS